MTTEKTISTTSTAEVIPMPPWQQIGVRAARTYLQALLGLIALTYAGQAGMPPDQFGRLLLQAAGMALAPTAVSLLMNVTEFLSGVAGSQPQLRA